MGFKLIEKEKDPTFYVLDINLDKVHKKPSFHLNLCLQRFIIASKIYLKSKFLNLFSMILSSYTPSWKFSLKMLNPYQILTIFGSYKTLTHFLKIQITKSVNHIYSPTFQTSYPHKKCCLISSAFVLSHQLGLKTNV